MFNPLFVFKLLSLKYKINVALLYNDDLHNTISSEKILVIFNKDKSVPKVLVDDKLPISHLNQENKRFYYHCYVCIYRRIKIKNNGAFVKGPNGEFLSAR